MTVAYEPRSFHSGYYQLEIAPDVGLIARPEAVSHDHDRVFVNEAFCCEPAKHCCCGVPLRLHVDMAVWNARRGSVFRENTRRTADGGGVEGELVVVGNYLFHASEWERVLAHLRHLLGGL